MVKRITVQQGSLQKKVAFLANMYGWKISPAEGKIVTALIGVGAMQFNLDARLAAELSKSAGIPQAVFNSLMARLVVKNVIRKESRVVVLNPALNKIEECNEFLVVFA